MSEIEKIQRYIERTPIGKSNRSISLDEGFALAKQAYDSDDLPLHVILLAFNYGRAKGYRAAKAEGGAQA